MIRTWQLKVPPGWEADIVIPVMHPEAKVVRVWGKKYGVAEVMDEPAMNMTALMDSPHKIHLLIAERTGQVNREADIPLEAGRYLGAFWDERTNKGFYVFTRTVAQPDASGKGR